MKPTTGTRRQFIATTSAAAAAFTIVPRHVLGGTAVRRPERQGQRGADRRRGPGPDQRARALPGGQLPDHRACRSGRRVGHVHVVLRRQSGTGAVKAEVEKHYAAKTPNHTCAVYEDFRVMLEKEKAIDAVLIATPDHLHAYVAIMAMKAGKHVYCEKPLTHNIREARIVARVAKETKVATQMGNHGRSGEGHRLTVEWVKDGAIGAVREVHAWSGTPRNAKSVWPGEGPAVKPAKLNWDLWLGPRSERPVQRQARSVRLAMGVGLRQRHHARHVAASLRSRVQRARPRRAGHRRSPGILHRPAGRHGQQHDDVSVPRPRRSRTADGVLVRQRPEAPDAARDRS